MEVSDHRCDVRAKGQDHNIHVPKICLAVRNMNSSVFFDGGVHFNTMIAYGL